MHDDLFTYQKSNFKISYQFRNKYFLIFPIYYLFILIITLIGYLTSKFFREEFNSNKPIFLTFTFNQSKIADLFKKSSTQLRFNFTRFNIKSNCFKFESLLFFTIKYGLNFSFFLKLTSLKNFMFFKMNWYRIINLIFIDRILSEKTINKKLVIVANDHSVYNNYVIAYCKKNDIRTMYIQHAPVTNKFPPLRCDYNILFSNQSKDIYKKISNSNSKFIVYSDLRLINFYRLKSNNNNNKNSILICTNEFDSILNVEKFVKFFLKKNYKITIRKHPADRRSWKINKSNLSSFSLIEDFKNHKIILCNETALILEAIVARKLVYKCKFSEFTDHYGYIKDGLVIKEYIRPDELYVDIRNEFITYKNDKIKYYTGDLNSYESHLLSINKLISSH